MRLSWFLLHHKHDWNQDRGTCGPLYYLNLIHTVIALSDLFANTWCVDSHQYVAVYCKLPCFLVALTRFYASFSTTQVSSQSRVVPSTLKILLFHTSAYCCISLSVNWSSIIISCSYDFRSNVIPNSCLFQHRIAMQTGTNWPLDDIADVVNAMGICRYSCR